ncbi:hypothetical protein C2G38_2245780 [Gigaspora rosea]|uniref:Uncharacterized protein n=1 Tax=Gigaspora rosea TaxID=44941 RepID=A0A397VF16_9GLOM|nr:hypothetical protein C2G38_2245780 [Gigaspora rosea]
MNINMKIKINMNMVKPIIVITIILILMEGAITMNVTELDHLQGKKSIIHYIYIYMNSTIYNLFIPNLI